MENTTIWDALRTPPKEALKTIQYGNLKGKSDINPQWRIQAMTEFFGPIGNGWKYSKTSAWTEEGPGGTVAAFVDVELFVWIDDKWSDPIHGTGGSMLVIKDKHGLHINDEAYKMATTDALSVAMKQLGVAADIYMGIMDGSKYQTPRNVKQTTDNYSLEEQARDLFDAKKNSLDPETANKVFDSIKKDPQKVIDYLKGI